VGAAEAVLFQDRVGVTGKAAVGEIKKLDARDQIGEFGAATSLRDTGLLSRCAAMF
jgi:hypothetical protein